MTAEFNTMLETIQQMVVKAGRLYLDASGDGESRSELYEIDVQVNKMERRIRKRIIAHLSLQGAAVDLPHCLLLMSLVKDAERLGDYAKNIAEIRDLHPGMLPAGDLLNEIGEIRFAVESIFDNLAEVFNTSDRDRAIEFIQAGRLLTQRADALLQGISRSSHEASVVTALVLGARYYKRTAGHLLNILSSVVMPLHKLDYYDERELESP